jgi:hypothetical protein
MSPRRMRAEAAMLPSDTRDALNGRRGVFQFTYRATSDVLQGDGCDVRRHCRVVLYM